MLALYLSLIDSEPSEKLFERIYHTYRKQMYFWANSILKNSHDAEDAVHDVFYSVAFSHQDVIFNAENEDDIRNYLLKSVKNASIDIIRKRKVRYEYGESIAIDSANFSDEEFLDRICSHFEASDLIDAMENLDSKYRDALYYHFVMGLSTEETAKLLNREPSTIRKQISRGKNMLLNMMSEKENSKCQ